MQNKTLKRWLHGATLLVTVLFSFGVFSLSPAAPKAHAADPSTTDNTKFTVTFVDRSHISYNGGLYFADANQTKSSLSQGIEYTHINYDTQGCTADSIFIGPSLNIAQMFTFAPSGTPTNKFCVRTIHPNGTATNTGAFNIGFTWIDSGTIETTDGVKKYLLDTKTATTGRNPGNYIQQENNKCLDYITPDSVGATSGVLVFNTDNPSNNGIDSYKPYMDTSHPTNRTTSNGCTQITYRIALGNPSAASQGPNEGAGPAGSGGNAGSATCESSAGTLGWIVCGVINLVDDTVKTIADSITSLLEARPLSTNPSDKYYAVYVAWQGVRGVANALLIVIFLIIIFGQTLSIDAYTIKKSLPRIVAASILIQFSFLICSLLIDFSNILGNGINGLITTALGPSHAYHLSSILVSGGTGIIVAATIAGISAVFSGAALVAAIAVLIAIFGVFLTLAFRALAIIALVIAAPLAMMLWVLPNTEKFARMWFTNFIKILLMFPLMAAIFAISDFAYGLYASTGDTAQQFLAIMLIIAPLFAIPWVFKWGGQLMNFGSGLILGRTGALAGKAQNAQWLKDRKQFRTQERQRKGADLAQNATGRLGFGAARRAQGRLQAAGVGGLLGTKRGTRLMEQRYRAGVAAAAEDFETAVNRSGLTNDELMGKYEDGVATTPSALASIAKASNGATVTLPNGRKVKVDAAVRQKAIQMMAGAGATEALAETRQGLGLDSPTFDATTPQGRLAQSIWNEGTRNSIPDLLNKAPDLVKGPGAFKQYSPEQLSSFKKDTLSRMEKAIRSASAEDRREMETTLQNALAGIAANSQIASRITPEIGLTIRSLAPAVGPTTRGVLESIIDPAGRINLTTPAAAASPGTPPAGTPPTT